MKKILVACGAGVATSTLVMTKLRDLLDNNGYKNQYKLIQCKITEAKSLADDADFLVATTAKPNNLSCDFVSGLAFLTGMGKDEVEKQILNLMAS